MYHFQTCQDESELMRTFMDVQPPPPNSVFRRGEGVVVLLLEQAGLHSSCGEGSRL